MRTIYYKTQIDENLISFLKQKYNNIHINTIKKIIEEHFTNIVNKVLIEPRGWKQYGYEFIFSSKNNDILTIELSSLKKILDKCKTKDLSCYVHNEKNIYINFNNWIGGSNSKLSINKYRYYVINHEVGHYLGFRHPSFNNNSQCDPDLYGKKGSIMMQMSKGPDFVYPCLENYLPLSNEIDGYNEVEKSTKFNWYIKS